MTCSEALVKFWRTGRLSNRAGAVTVVTGVMSAAPGVSRVSLEHI